MKNCSQTESQSVYQHGESVQHHMLQLVSYLENNQITGSWILPNWLIEYRSRLKDKLLPLYIIKEYTLYHDCGKPYCLTLDDEGKRHFPNHADKSYQTWIAVGGNMQAAQLMKMDMMIHTLKDVQVDEFVLHPEAITLLLVGLAEIHSNAKMFGGTDSTSFKIKWNQINKRGKKICHKLFGE